MSTTLVGRDTELATLSGWLDDALAGEPRVVLLGGEAGIGKTRLAHELGSIAVSAGVTVAWGRGTEQEGAPPFWPWRQVLERLGRADVFDSGQQAEPEVERFARFVQVTTVLASAAAAGGVLVVLDDVHQVDVPSLRLLVHVAGSISGRMLVLATHRSNVADDLAGLARAAEELQRLPVTRRLELIGLGRDAVAQMLGLGHDDPLVVQVAQRGGGNPLLVGELARHLRAGHDVASVPPSVRDGVRIRLGARSASCARTLAIASIVGREFEAGLVATAAGEPAMTVLSAIDEAVDAGLVEPAERPGRYRFVHALVRDAVEATHGHAGLPVVHRRVAEAIERYHGTTDDALPELARHWSVAAAMGDREIAASWSERAAQAADGRTAWEEAARLYDRAAELTGTDAEPEALFRRLLGSARARLHCDEIAAAVERSMAAAEVARRLGRPELLAEACLIAEGRGGSVELLSQLHALAEAALATLDPADHALRARVLGQLATTAFYVDPAATETLSREALAEADVTDDPLAIAAAIRARQMCLIEPHHAEQRLALAARLGASGRTLGRPTITQWESIWRIDALLELGRVDEARRELIELRRRVAAVGLPISRLHLARVEALLAHAAGRFDAAIGWSERSRDLFAMLEDELGADGIHLSFSLGVQRHAGYEPDTARQILELDYGRAPAFLGDLPALAPIQALVGIGDIDRARDRYDRLASPATWFAPPFLRFAMTAVRVELAVAVERLDDLPALIAVLEGHRGLHAGASGGGVIYLGCAELWLGVARRALGEHTAAVADLRYALDVAARAGTPPIAVQTATELAAALAGRADTGDRDEAAALADAWRPEAVRLGMQPWIARLDGLCGGASPSDPGPLSARELEVAELVARGFTNQQIAHELFVSPRTAQNHVQHILTKLGVSNRTQIAVWFNTR